MAEHSICQPGRPGPQGLSQAGSPGLEPFQRAKSPGCRLIDGRLDPGPGLEGLGVPVAELAVLGGPGHVEVDVAARGVGEPLVDQALRHRHDLGDVLGRPGHVVDPVDPQRLRGSGGSPR